MSIAFYLPGDVPIYIFSLILGLGATIGLAAVAWQSPAEFARRYVDAGLWSLVGALLGGRAVFVAINWGYFREYPWEGLQVYLGGLSWAGALGGGLLALVLVSALSDMRIGTLVTALLPLLATLAVSAWLSCWQAGCAYGPPSNSWWGIPSRDEWGNLVLRWPTQLLGALLALGLFWLLDWRRRVTGAAEEIAGFTILGFSLQMLALSFLRVDPLPVWYGLRSDTWAALALSLVGAIALAIVYLGAVSLKARTLKE